MGVLAEWLVAIPDRTITCIAEGIRNSASTTSALVARSFFTASAMASAAPWPASMCRTPLYLHLGDRGPVLGSQAREARLGGPWRRIVPPGPRGVGAVVGGVGRKSPAGPPERPPCAPPANRRGDRSSVNSTGRCNTLKEDVAMTDRKRRSDQSGRAPLRSPGRPSVAGRDERRRHCHGNLPWRSAWRRMRLAAWTHHPILTIVTGSPPRPSAVPSGCTTCSVQPARC